MTKGVWFWVIMVLWLIFSLYWYWPASGGEYRYVVLTTPVVLFVLLGLLGWQVFGPPVKG